MAIILQNAAILTVDAANRYLPAADLRIEDAKIAGIGAARSLAQPGDEIIDCSEALVAPGFVNTHTHAATAHFRGRAEDMPREFWEQGYLVPGQEKFTPEDQVISVKAAAGEFLLNGVTCIADRLKGMERIGPALEESGIRAVLGETISDARAPADWRVTEMLLERFGTKPSSRITAGIAPHALDTCSDELLKQCRRIAGHKGALECLERTGLASPLLVAAHAIYLSDDEFDALPETGLNIAHCPASNLKIEARTLPLHKLIGKMPIGLGTDWTASNNSMDLALEARLAALIGKMVADDPTKLGVTEMIRMLTIDGARALGLDSEIGSIEAGKRADLVVIDKARLEMTPDFDAAANLIYAFNPRCVRDVFVDGARLVANGKLTRADEAELARAQRRLV